MGFIRLVSQLFNISELEAAFYVGGIVIAGVSGLIGRLMFRMGVWNKARGAPYATMIAFTTKTPYQVIREARVASMKLLLTWIIILLVLACGGFYLYANRFGEAQTIVQIVDNLLRSFLAP